MREIDRLSQELGTSLALHGVLVRASNSPLTGVLVKDTDTRALPKICRIRISREELAF